MQNKDEFEDVRASAAEALGLLGDKSAIDDLREVFNQKAGDGNEWCELHSTVGVALIRLQGVKAFPLITEALITSRNGQVPVAIIEAMGTVGGEPAISALRDILNLGDGFLSEYVVQALKTIKTTESLMVVKLWKRGKR